VRLLLFFFFFHPFSLSRVSEVPPLYFFFDLCCAKWSTRPVPSTSRFSTPFSLHFFLRSFSRRRKAFFLSGGQKKCSSLRAAWRSASGPPSTRFCSCMTVRPIPMPFLFSFHDARPVTFKRVGDGSSPSFRPVRHKLSAFPLFLTQTKHPFPSQSSPFPLFFHRTDKVEYVFFLHPRSGWQVSQKRPLPCTRAQHHGRSSFPAMKEVIALFFSLRDPFPSLSLVLTGSSGPVFFFFSSPREREELLSFRTRRRRCISLRPILPPGGSGVWCIFLFFSPFFFLFYKKGPARIFPNPDERVLNDRQNLPPGLPLF